MGLINMSAGWLPKKIVLSITSAGTSCNIGSNCSTFRSTPGGQHSAFIFDQTNATPTTNLNPNTATDLLVCSPKLPVFIHHALFCENDARALITIKLESSPICLAAKLWMQPDRTEILMQSTICNQGISIDCIFIVQWHWNIWSHSTIWAASMENHAPPWWHITSVDVNMVVPLQCKQLLLNGLITGCQTMLLTAPTNTYAWTAAANWERVRTFLSNLLQCYPVHNFKLGFGHMHSTIPMRRAVQNCWIIQFVQIAHHWLPCACPNNNCTLQEGHAQFTCWNLLGVFLLPQNSML